MRDRQSNRGGFTWIELLIALAIGAVLVSLLLPAIQRARALARRTRCHDNIRQLGEGLQVYHAVWNHFPPGGTGPRRTSFFYDILPHINELPTFQQISPVDDNIPQNTRAAANYITPQPHTGRPLLASFRPANWLCPDSPLPRFNAAGVVVPCYAGVSGSVITNTIGRGMPGYRIETGTSGRVSSGGVLVPNSVVRCQDVTDGLSSTILLVEQSDWGLDNTQTKYDLRSCHDGFLPGPVVPTGFPHGPGTEAWRGANATNCLTTLASRLNDKEAAAEDGPGGNGPTGTNKPLQSAHHGGAFAAWADGSARFVSDMVSETTLSHLASRNDHNSLFLD